MSATIQEQLGSLSQISWTLKPSELLSTSNRNEALEILQTNSFPTTKDEFWKYTRLSKLRQLAVENSKHQQLSELSKIEETSYLLVFENGRFRKDLSSTSFPDGVKILAFSEMDEEERIVIERAQCADNDLFEALNTAYLTDGLYIHVSAKIEIKDLIEIRHITTTNALSNYRLHLVLEAFSQLRILERTETQYEGQSFKNQVRTLHLAKNSTLDFYTIQQSIGDNYEVNNTVIDQSTDSTLTHHSITLSGQFVRNNIFCNVNGKNCTTNLYGAYLPKSNSIVDNHTIIDHKVAHCESNELYKGILDDNSIGVFNGKVFVRKDAQKINAFQSNSNVLLSEKSQMNSKPELEIYADDVKCSHGSTTGQIDDQAIFYLRARGINERKAKELMNHAFIGEVFDKIEIHSVKELVYKLLTDIHDWDSDHIV